MSRRLTAADRAHREATLRICDRMLADIGFGGLENLDEHIAHVRGEWRAWRRMQRGIPLRAADETPAEVAYRRRVQS